MTAARKLKRRGERRSEPLPRAMPLIAAARFWGVSPNWLRILNRRPELRDQLQGRLIATPGQGAAYYEFPAGATLPELPKGAPPR